MVALWLDEEWTPLDVHTHLGRAVADAYGRLRMQDGGGEADMTDLLLGLGSELMTFDFTEAFVGPFDVANKVVEMLMMRDGADVCCTLPADAERMARYNATTGALP